MSNQKSGHKNVVTTTTEDKTMRTNSSHHVVTTTQPENTKMKSQDYSRRIYKWHQRIIAFIADEEFFAARLLEGCNPQAFSRFKETLDWKIAMSSDALDRDVKIAQGLIGTPRLTAMAELEARIDKLVDGLHEQYAHVYVGYAEFQDFLRELKETIIFELGAVTLGVDTDRTVVIYA